MEPLILVLSLLLLSAASHADSHRLPLDLSTEEYFQLSRSTSLAPKDSKISTSIKLGERLRTWVKKVNEGRTDENKIRLTSPETRRSFPIHKPSFLSPSTVSEALKNIQRTIPENVLTILTGTGELPPTLPVSDEVFIKFARPLEFNYQDAVRYNSLIPDKLSYAKAQRRDVRGYYYLTTQRIGAHELRDTARIPKEDLPKIKDALIGICFNDYKKSKIGCKTAYQKAFFQNKLADFYTEHFPQGEKAWKRFFEIHRDSKKDYITSSEMEMIVPFQMPTEQKFLDFLKYNIEDEFKFEHWALKMNFGDFPKAPRLQFIPNTTPHVPKGDKVIVMDPNQPLDEYDAQWTIRHEFGHILGLPDCYHEFYDTDIDSFVNYQLDVTDLMCSRAGNMNERIYKELQRVYLK